MKINTQLLKRIKRAIMKEPTRLDMDSYFYEEDNRKYGPPCKTVGCIAGWAVLFDTQDRLVAAPKNGVNAKVMVDVMNLANEEAFRKGVDVERTASRILGTGVRAGRRLFFVERWPKKFQDAYHAASNPAQIAKVTCARINLFIRTGGTE